MTRALVTAYLLVVSAPFLAGCRCPVVDSGHRGIVFETLGGGTSRKTLSEGMHVMPIWNAVIAYDLRVHEMKEQLSVLSSNGLAIRVDASVRYRPKAEEMYELQTQIGPNYADIVVAPVVRSEARKVFGRYAPEEIYSTKREEIERQIYEEVLKAVEGINKYQSIVRQGLTPEYLQYKGIEATQKLAESPNAKIVVVGNAKNGLPLIFQQEGGR